MKFADRKQEHSTFGYHLFDFSVRRIDDYTDVKTIINPITLNVVVGF
jgi:hypothetical protein